MAEHGSATGVTQEPLFKIFPDPHVQLPLLRVNEDLHAKHCPVVFAQIAQFSEQGLQEPFSRKFDAEQLRQLVSLVQKVQFSAQGLQTFSVLL